MTRYHGRHRAPTTTGRTAAKLAVTGLVVGACRRCVKTDPLVPSEC